MNKHNEHTIKSTLKRMKKAHSFFEFSLYEADLLGFLRALQSNNIISIDQSLFIEKIIYRYNKKYATKLP